MKRYDPDEQMKKAESIAWFLLGLIALLLVFAVPYIVVHGL